MADAEKIEISNLEELKAFRDAVNAGESYKGKTVVLTADIDLKNEEWTPIGNSTNSFQGNFDGQGHTVSNLKIDGTGKSNQGFFGFTTNGSVSNLTIKNATVTGRLNVGVVAGTPYTSKYTNIKVTGHVEVEGMAYVGGVGGKNAYADWTDITVDVDETSFVKADSVENGTAYRTYVGGVIGFMGEGGHTLKNITSNINVEGSTCDVGGIAGIAHYQNNFENVSCTAKEIVVNGDDAEVGAIAGVWMDSSVGDVTMINCTVSENTKVYKTVTDGENAVKTEVDALNGASYNGSTAGELLTATKTTDAYGAVALEITKVDGTGAKRDISESEVKKVAAADTGAASFIVGDYDVADYEGSNVVMDANGKIVGGSFTATESADSAAFSAALSENVQQQTDGSIANLSMISVDDDYAALTEGAEIAPGIIFGVNAFASIQDAVKAATDGATIVVKGGTYGEYVTLSKEAVGSIKELNIIAAAGEEVNFTGTFQIGYRVDGTSSSPWSKHLTVDGFIFKPETGEEKGSFVFQEVHGGLTVKNSVFSSIRDTDAYLLSCKTGQDHVVMDALFENCSFTGGRIQSTSQAQDDLIFSNCTFTDVKINLQNGKGAIFNASTFNYYFANGELTYIIRTNNDQAIEISGSTFNVDAAEDFVVEYKNGVPDFGMLWARQAGNASWVVEGCEVNFTAAALEVASKEQDFAFIYNASTDAEKAMKRITVIDMTSENSAEELAAILASSSGMVNVISDGKKTVYADGVALPMDKIVVDATKTAGEVFEVDGVSYMIGINAFTTLAEAAEKAADGTLIDISGATVSTATFVNGGTVTLTGNANLDWSKGWFFIGRGTNAQDTTLIIKDAAIGSTSDNATYGFHVSNAEKDSSSKANGTLIIDNSAVTTDYLINKNVVNVIGDGDFDDGEVDFQVKNGFYVAGRNSNETVDGVAHTAYLNITNGAYVKIGNENSMGIGAHASETGNADGKGVLNITDSKFESTQYLNCNSDGIINVTNGELVVAGNLNNSGSINVAGESELHIGTLTGDDVNLLDGTVLTGSTVGGTVYVAGNVTFKGDNSFGLIKDYGTYFDAEHPSKWTVAEGASVKFTGTGRYSLGYGDNVVVNGTIADALTTDKNAVKASLYIGEGISIDGDSSNDYLTVNNAYVVISDRSGKTVSNKATYSGNATLKFTNSLVDIFKIQTQEAANGSVNYIFDKCVLSNSSHLENADDDSAITVKNGSIVNIGSSFRNDGEFAVLSGSTVYVAAYSWSQDRQNFGTLTVDGENTKFILNNTSAGNDFRTSGTVNVKNGAVFVADYITNGGTINVYGGTLNAGGTITNNDCLYIWNGAEFSAGSVVNNYYMYIADSTLTDQTITGSSEDAYIRVERAVFNNVDISGNDIYAVDTVYNGGSFGYVYNGYGVVDGEWKTIADSETAVSGNVTADYFYNYGKILLAGELTAKAYWDYGTITVAENSSAVITSTDVTNGYTRLQGTLQVDGELTVNNIVQMYDVDVNGTMTVNGGLHLIGYKQFEVNGTLNVVTDGSGNDGSWHAIYIGVEGAYDYINSNTVKMTVSGADAKVNITGKNGSKAENVVVCYNARVDQAASLEILDGAEFVTNGDVINQGTLTIDADSMLVAATLTMADGSTLTIDADGFVSGVRKIIDLSGTSSLENKITVSNLGEGVNVVYGSDGDVTLVNVDQSEVLINTGYTSQDAVDAALGENFKTYGGNAFESIASAVANTAANNPLKLLFTGSDTVASTGIVYVTADTDPNVAPHSIGNFDGRDVTISGINNSAERLWVDLNDTATDDTVAASKLTFDNAKLNVSKLKASYNSVININNSELNAEYIQSSNLYGKGNGIINVTGSKLIGFNQTSALGGAVISLSDSELESGSYNRIEQGSLNVLNGSKYTFSVLSIAQGGTLNVTDSVAASKEMLSAADVANVQVFKNNPNKHVIVKVGYDLENNESAGTLNLTGSEFTLTKAQYEENGEIKYTGDAQFIVGAQSTVNVTNSEFTADTVTNAGAFNVSGVSQLTIGTLTGAVKVTDAVLTDSVIGGGKGDVHTYGNVIVENGTFLNAEGSSRTGLTVMGGTTGLKGDVSTLVLGTDHARGTGVEKVLVISDGADVSVGLTGEDGSELKVGYLYARNDAEIIIEEGGKLNLNGQLSNRGTVTLKGKMEVAGVNGVGPIHLAGAGDPDEYGTMIIDGGELTDRKTSHQNANYLYTNTTMEIGHGGDQTSEVKVINGGKINTTNSYWNIYSDGVFKIQDSSVSIAAPTNNPGVGVTWEPQEFVMTNAGTIEISDASLAVDSLTNSGTITLNDTDSVTVQSLIVDYGVINLTNSTLTVAGKIIFKSFDWGSGSLNIVLGTGNAINMDWQSQVVVGSWVEESGESVLPAMPTISVDVTGIESSGKTAFKVLDTLDGSYPNGFEGGEIIGTGKEEWHLEAVNGDAYLTSGDQSVLYVNSAYANDEDGIVEDGKIVGYNAFANLDDAFKVNNAEKIVLKSSGLALNGNADYNDSFSSAKKADFTLTADEAVTVTFNGNNQLIGNVVLDKNVNVILKGIDGKAAGLLLGSKGDTNAAGNTYQINGSIVNDGIAHFYVRNHKETVDVNGEIKILHYGNNQIYNKGTMNVTGTGKNYGVDDYQVTADFINVNGVVDDNGVRKGGELNLVDTAANFTTFRLGNGDDETCSTVNVNNSFLNVGGFISENSSAQIKLTGSTLNYSNVPVNVGYGNAVIGLGTDVSMTLDNSTVDAAALLSYGAISAVNGSKLDIETFTNNGTVSINDATFTAGNITNSGTITLTGNAELNSNVALNGKGAKLFFGTEEAGYNGTFAGDISLAGGSVGSNYPEYGQLQIVNGNVTMTGDITGGNDSKFTVGGSIYNNDSTARATLVLKDNTVSVGAVWIGAGNDCMDDPALKDGRFKLVVDGANLTANASGNSCIRNTGAVEVVNGGTFTYRGSQNSIRSEVLVSGEKSIFNSKNLNVYGNENAGAAVLKYTDNASGEVIQGLTFGHSTKANRQGLLVVEKSSSLSVSGGLINNIGGTVSVTEASTLKVDNITNKGSFAIDYLSGMTFSGSITNSGTFAVNTDGYDSKTYLVVDYTGSADSMDYSFVTGDNLLAFNNDLYVTAQNNDVIYVNSAYTGNVGDVTVDGKIIGYNAYSSFYNDGANWNDYADYFNGVEKFVLTAGNTVAYGNLRCSAYDNPTITIETVGSGAALINRLQIAGASNKCSVIIAEGSYIQVLNTGKESFVNPESTLTINGTLEVNATQAAGSSWRTYGSTSTQPGHTIVAETGKLIFNGGQVYNTGTMTVYGEMQINAEYWDAFAKLAGDETGNYASDFYIIGGSVNVDQRAFSIGGGWGSNWGEPHSGEANFSITDGGKFTSSAVVFRGGTSAVLTIDNSSMTFGNRADGSAWTGTGGGDYVSTYDGTINLTAGTLNLGVIDFVNNGTITMDHKSTIAFSTLTNNGTFTIDLSQYSDGAFKVLDSINNNYTVEMYQALLGNAYDNRFIVVDGDLFIADFADSEIYVNNNSYSGNVGDVTADGKIIGVNAFATVDDAIAAGAQKVIVSGGEYGKTGFDGVKATIGNVTYSGAVYGGNCDENAVVSETIDLTISGGELQSAVYGGSRVHGGTSYTSGGICAVAGDVNVKVTSGSVQNVFVGGDLVTQALMFVREGDINVNISGGEFNDRVYGGITVHATANESCMAQLVGNINMTISGGDFKDRVYGGNLAGKYERGDKLTVTGNISVALDVSSNSVSFAEHLVLGSSGTSAVHGNTRLTLTGLGSNLAFADNSVIVGGSGDSYYLVEGGNRTPVSFVEGTKEFAFNAFTGALNAQIKIFDTMSFAGNSEVNFADSAINLDEISNWNFESGSLITGAANAISFNGDTINLNGSWEAGAAFELGNIDAFGDYTAWNDVTVYYGGSAVNYQFEEKDSKLVITKLA